jgi:hypothetical protein
MDMAEIAVRPKLTMDCTLRLDEMEMGALWALQCYGTDGFIETFYKHMGTTYLRPYEEGLRTLFKTASAFDGHAKLLRQSYDVFTGVKIAVDPPVASGRKNPAS